MNQKVWGGFLVFWGWVGVFLVRISVAGEDAVCSRTSPLRSTGAVFPSKNIAGKLGEAEGVFYRSSKAPDRCGGQWGALPPPPGPDDVQPRRPSPALGMFSSASAFEALEQSFPPRTLPANLERPRGSFTVRVKLLTAAGVSGEPFPLLPDPTTYSRGVPLPPWECSLRPQLSRNPAAKGGPAGLRLPVRKDAERFNRRISLLVGFISVNNYPWTDNSAYSYFQIVTMCDLVMILFFYIIHIFRIYRKLTCVSWPLAEFLHYLIGTILLLIASIVAASKSYNLSGLVVGATFGFLATILCVLSIWSSYKVSCITQSTSKYHA
ncbi:PREDICTED: CKLF-like MARVEL transmembrane domain-containing protein 7 [Charadrius vociferus]|uniref:CKLF-like MARVEL transmembrane domain-containing protein 7 n=1 Tax=Charadrius vociferus TaxID=50402 RepID=UPI00052195A8|nr:PREDICTED: CKLF-like MARVEL transmembrane domain-containing protein 7 [Charadrius vociferus]